MDGQRETPRKALALCYSVCAHTGQMERRLAAVLIADVVGYSRLSQADEEGTRASFQADLEEIFRPRIGQRHGRLVKTMVGQLSHLPGWNQPWRHYCGRR
jgi:class 3 adenylate cyclase